MAFTTFDYTVGWISALPVELAAAKAMMDKPLHPILPQDTQDTNNYTLGRIGKHNVVLAIPPNMGVGAAAQAAANLLRSFPNIRFGLMVGIGGGVPGALTANSMLDNSMLDIRLGDVVVSYPKQQHGGVIQYDFGTEIQESNGSEFVRKGHLDKPPPVLLTALRNLQANDMTEPLKFQRHYEEMLENYPTMSRQYLRPDNDELYSSYYIHQGDKADCSQCPKEQLIARNSRTVSIVHYGLIGSANRVLRNAVERDRLHEEEGIICFEMEAAGLMNEFPCVVIRGICDYCDSHKSKQWQAYSSAIAAAYAKELLLNIAPKSVDTLPRLSFLINLVEQQLDKTHQTNESLRKITSKLESVEDVAAHTRHTECIEALNCLHPRYDKARLEDTKGGLLRDAYKWVLETKEYKSWQSIGGLLWIKGNPGKGKTMLVCGIVDELKHDDKAYFFCQATINTNNTATMVLRGLIFAALDLIVPLSDTLSGKIAQASKLPQESAFYVYSDIIDEILSSQKMVILIDALDECLSGQDMLLRYIVKSSASHSSQWLVTSRNIPAIGDYLNQASRLSLELNDRSVSDAVHGFIRHKVRELARAKDYDADLQTFVLRYLLDNAEGTFLWVSLVCSSLLKIRPRETKAELLEYPPSLRAVYQRMLSIIEEAKDAHKLKQILSTICIVFRPITLDELGSLIDLPEEDMPYLEDFISECGSFLNIRQSSIEFVHQSAKDFLLEQEPQHILSCKKINLHHRAFVKSLEALQSLKRNMYSLIEPGTSLDEVVIPDPDPLKDIRYACLYWIDHLMQSYERPSIAGISATDASLILNFLEMKYLYWLESLSLLEQVYPATLKLLKLQFATQFDSGSEQPSSDPSEYSIFQEFVNDSIQFIQYFQQALVHFPLQVYISGLLFCPSYSLIKQRFWHEAPTWASVERGLEEYWPSYLSLDNVDYPRFLLWSADAERLAALDRNGISTWDVTTGQLLTTFEARHEFAFADSGATLMTISDNGASIALWSTITGELLETKMLRDSKFPAPVPKSFGKGEFESAFSDDASLVARAHSWIHSVEIHRTSCGGIVRRIPLYDVEFMICNLSFNISKSLLVVARANGFIEVLDIESGYNIWSTPSKAFSQVMFSRCSTVLAIASDRLEMWDWQSDRIFYSLPAIGTRVDSAIQTRKVTFLQDTVLVSNATELEEWDLKSPTKHGNHMSFGTKISAVRVCNDGQKIAAATVDAVRVWHLDKAIGAASTIDDSSNTESLKCVYFNGKTIYTVSDSDTSSIRMRSVAVEDNADVTLRTQVNSDMCSMSPNGSNIALWGYYNKSAEIWNLDHGRRLLLMNSSGDNSLMGMGWGPGEAQITISQLNQTAWLECWSISEARMVRRLALPSNREVVSDKDFEYLFWSPTGSHLLMSSEFGLDLWTEDQTCWRNVLEDNGYSCVNESCMSFSADASLFAYISAEKDLKLFKTDTLNMLLSIRGHGLSFLLSIDDHWLKTDRAWYGVPHTSTKIDKLVVSRRNSEHLNIESDPWRDKTWLRSGETNIIWLPPEYRPAASCWDTVKSKIVLGMDATRFTILDVRWNHSIGSKSQYTEGTELSPRHLHKRRRSSVAIYPQHKKIAESL